MIDELMPEGVPINVEKDMSEKYWSIFEEDATFEMVKDFLVMQDSVTTLKVTSDAC